MRNRLLLPALVGLVGLGVGLLLAFANPAQYGPTHSCPAGASRAACSYPPDLVAQRVRWALLGALAGLVLTSAVVSVKSA